MATDTTKLTRLLDALELFENGIFSQLSNTEKLRITVALNDADPDLADNNALLRTFYAGYKVIEAMGFADVSFFDKLMIAAQVMRMTSRNEIMQPVEKTYNNYASSVLTVVDLLSGDTVQIGAVLLTAVEAEATPGAYEFAIGEDAAETTTNILAALDYIGGVKITLFSYNAVEGETAKIYFQSKLPGTAGNAIDTIVTTEGTSAFTSVKMSGGVDANAGTTEWDGRVAVSLFGNAKEYLGNAWLEKYNKYTVEFTDADLVNAEPAVAAYGTLTIVNDIAALDTIQIGDTTITCVDADPTAGQFLKGEDAAATVTNILACLTAITQEQFIFADISTEEVKAIGITAAIAGLGGNTIATVVTSSGTSDFAAETLTGGLDIRTGNPIMDDLGAMQVKPDILKVKFTISGDYSVTPMAVIVPDSYMFDDIEVYNSNPSDIVKNITVKDRASNSLINCTKDLAVDTIWDIRRKDNEAAVPGCVYLYVTTDSTTANLQLTFNFKRYNPF